MKTDTPEPLYERYRLAYPSGTVVMVFYAGGAPLEEVRVTHPMAVVEVVEQEAYEMKVNPMGDPLRARGA